MKKILLALIAIAMIFAITACSQDQYKSLGEAMGKMSGNIYGITANLKDVENATNKVDGAVAVNGDDVTVTIDASAAQSIVNSVVAVKNSATKKEALKSSLAEPAIADATEVQKTKLKEEIKKAVSIIDTSELSGDQKALAELVNAVLKDVKEKDSLSDNPTKAELATVAVLATLADAVKSGDEAAYKEAGKAAVEALKITSEIGRVDIFANVSVSSLFDMLGEKAIARDGEEEDTTWLPVFGNSVSEIMACITENKQFSEPRYNKFVMECKAMRASYEMIAKGYDIDVEAPLKGQAAVDSGLVIEDLGHYIISVVFSAVDTYANGTIKFLTSLIDGDGESDGYYDALVDFDMDALPDFEDDAIDMDDEFADSLIDAMDGDVDIDMADLEFGDAVKQIIRDKNTAVGGKIDSVLRTIGVILIDSEYEALLSQIEVTEENAPEKGSLKCFLYAF